MRLAETAVLAGGLDRGRGFHRLAERLHRDARCRRNVVLGDDNLDGCGCGGFYGLSDHLPTSLILALLLSG